MPAMSQTVSGLFQASPGLFVTFSGLSQTVSVYLRACSEKV